MFRGDAEGVQQQHDRHACAVLARRAVNQHRCIVFRKQLKQYTQPRRQHARQLPVNLKHHVACALRHRIIDQHGGNPWVGTHIANNFQMQMLDGGLRQAVRVTLTLAHAA
ncbi:hypothetical protein D3C84_915420 [compost metagenome]